MAKRSSQTQESATPPSLKKSISSSVPSKNQKSILGFFQRTPVLNKTPTSRSNADSTPKQQKSVKHLDMKQSPSQSLTPVPSSDGPDIEDETLEDNTPKPVSQSNGDFNLPSPGTPAHDEMPVVLPSSSPSRMARRKVNYAESDDGEESDENAFLPTKRNSTRGRAVKRRKMVVSESEDDDDFKPDNKNEIENMDDEMDDFIVADESEDDVQVNKKRKRPQKTQSSKASDPLPPPSDIDEEDQENISTSTAHQWTYDPENVQPLQPRSVNSQPRKSNATGKKFKEKAHLTEPDQRYSWLANVTDADRNPPGHPNYDPRTIYIPPMAWNKFSPFEKQYWEIKQKFWDTIVFFKKGKFYELYENDATIGHQLFDLKLTDRVNMRMVGVPEASLDQWANQFVAKGYKIARVDQKETALGKEMRERNGKKAGKPAKEDKIIHRELACVLTAGTLVDGGMLQDDMSTYCVSIKESTVDELPAFGLCFTDTATGQFFMTEFVDDQDLTKFETFVAQTRPQELLLEKGAMSVKALRILRNNTGPTCIWNFLKPEKEFWTADVTSREIDASKYFVSENDDNLETWPKVLREARDKELVMSATGALICYLRTLKIDQELVTLGNFSWYDPIKKATSLVLDGQTLINLEVFANSFDGGSDGTLFALLNRCVTPFGKRMFKQWVCHPLVESRRINARLDAVDTLNADFTVRDRFTSQLTKLPDLERLISRVHAGRCKAQDFVRVLEGYEQIDYTMSLVGDLGDGEGVIGQLISAMPDLSEKLKYWKTAFDHTKAKENGILVPEPGVEEDFDESQRHIEKIHAALDSHLKKVRREIGTNAIFYRDNGKEIYQLEVPNKLKVPKGFDQMSATQKVKRYYNPELRGLVRELQEAQETHAQIVKEVAGRFYAKFDEDYTMWLAAVKIIARLDCLISLAKASMALGEPSCRPVFVDDERSVIEFEDLRHPCMLPNVDDFIPNDVKLGGDVPNINLLTGANAAGKSTILRMSCVAVIMAQIGCYIPCRPARLTPVDRIMSRLGANDNIFAAQSTFFVELSETKKILSEATPRSLVILDELGRGTSSYDGVAVAQAVLYHIATHIGCTGFFATHYHSLGPEFAGHPEIAPKRMRIHVDNDNRQITFLYKLEDGVAEGSFGMHCAAMCGIPSKVIDRAEVAAKEWEHTSRLKESLDKAKSGSYVPLGIQSDISRILKDNVEDIDERGLDVLARAIEAL
ncbi:MAG: DNA mismatch repair protein msh6 [Cirrosporium novae-zelandiae]|nr:MAG: DNA mismatch repair protein msh6 [Cirrosporium novae-zelandiae]